MPPNWTNAGIGNRTRDTKRCIRFAIDGSSRSPERKEQRKVLPSRLLWMGRRHRQRSGSARQRRKCHANPDARKQRRKRLCPGKESLDRRVVAREYQRSKPVFIRSVVRDTSGPGLVQL